MTDQATDGACGAVKRMIISFLQMIQTEKLIGKVRPCVEAERGIDGYRCHIVCPFSTWQETAHCAGIQPQFTFTEFQKDTQGYEATTKD